MLPEPLCDITDSKPFLWEETEQIPLIPDEVRQYMESQIGESGETALDALDRYGNSCSVYEGF